MSISPAYRFLNSPSLGLVHPVAQRDIFPRGGQVSPIQILGWHTKLSMKNCILLHFEFCNNPVLMCYVSANVLGNSLFWTFLFFYELNKHIYIIDLNGSSNEKSQKEAYDAYEAHCAYATHWYIRIFRDTPSKRVIKSQFILFLFNILLHLTSVSPWCVHVWRFNHWKFWGKSK